MGTDPENRVGDQDTGSLGRSVSSGLQVPVSPFLPGRAKDLSEPCISLLHTVIICYMFRPFLGQHQRDNRYKRWVNHLYLCIVIRQGRSCM
jgi:hypothetical protein